MSTFNISKIVDSIPSPGIDFEYCAVKQTQTKSFTLTNPTNSLVTIDIQQDLSEGTVFKIEPRNGKLPIFLK